MGVRWPSTANKAVVNSTITAATTTLILVSSPINLSIDSQQVMIFWTLLVATGTLATQLLVQVFRGATSAGVPLNSLTPQTVAASTTYYLSGCYPDTPGIVAEQQWCVAVTQAPGGVGNGSVSDGAIMVLAL